MKLSRFLILQLNGLFPFMYLFLHLFRGGNYIKGILFYIRDYGIYFRKDRTDKSPFPLKFTNNYPIYFDRFEEAGEVPKHYFYQDLYFAKKIYTSKVKTHYDIGSRLDSFISHCLVFCKVVMLDIRPLKSFVPGLKFQQADGMDMKNVRTGSIESISTLHAIEHFGLGRYGDPIDPMGHKKAISEIQRVTKKGGNIYFSTPIGRQRIEFNAHRVFDPMYIVKLFDACELVDFSAVDDNNNLIEKTQPAKFRKAFYSCGMYHFRKK